MLMKVNDKKITPQLRFPEFKNSGEWEEDIAKNIFITINEKNHPELSVLAATQEYGMVKRDDINYKIQYNSENTISYKKVSKGDFVIHLRSFQGGFAYSDIEGITSPAYTVFRIKDKSKHYPYFWKHIFTSNQFIKKLELITYGVRDGRSISFKDFSQFKFPTPPLKEQQKIADFFSLVDELIDNEKIKLENLKEYKKGLLQNLFPKENQKVPDLRFPEFKNSGEWEEKKLGDILVESRIPGSQGSIAKKISLKLWGKGVTIKKENILGSNNTKYYIRKKGQFIYSKLDFLNQAFAIIPDEFDGFETTTDLPCFDVSKLINKFFLLEFIKLPNIYKTYGVLFANGGRKAKRVQVKDFLKIKILVPIYKEQQKIADFLSSVEKLIIEQVEKIQLLQEYKKGLLQKLFL